MLSNCWKIIDLRDQGGAPRMTGSKCRTGDDVTPHPATRAGASRCRIPSAFRVLQPLDRDPVHALQRQPARGVENVGELPRSRHEGSGDVQGGDEVLVEDLFVRG